MNDEFESGEVITSYKLNKKTIYHGSEEPNTKIDGMLWLKDDGTLVRWTGSEWHTVAIPTGHVKLPAPSTSDYITPSDASASSESYIIEEELEDPSEYVEQDTNGVITVSEDTENYYSGAGSCKVEISGDAESGDYGGWQKDLNLTDVSTLYFYVLGPIVDLSGYAYVKVYIDGSEVASWDAYTGNFPSGWTEKTVDVSGYTGIHTVKIVLSIANNPAGTWGCNFDYVRSDAPLGAGRAIDDDTGTYWQPDPANEGGAWIEVDIGQLEIVGAIRVYFPDASYIPASFKISVSEDGSSWEDVLTGQSGEVGWNEYSFNARYVRYIRLTVEDYGSASGIKVGEIDYYSQIVGRVAALHGHGSGVIRWRKGHGVRAGFTLEARMEALEKELDALHSGLMVRKDVGELWNYLKLSREYEKLLLKYIGFLKRLGY
ncbi:MAG: discoidin domain-containing protein [Thaumarchaeota archaeon]|nr:discoidin domain-containing protein [Nitrososphaerota archaeon]